jgi:hypothetical protein
MQTFYALKLSHLMEFYTGTSQQNRSPKFFLQTTSAYQGSKLEDYYKLKLI